MSFLFGNKDKISQVPTFSPEQQQFLSQILGQLGMGGQTGGTYGQSQDYLSGILSGDTEAYNQFAAPYLQQFQEQILPGISERFAGLGGGLGGGNLGSSGFGQAIGGATSGLQAQLANLFANLRQNASQQAMGQYNQLANLGLGSRSFENIYQPGSTGLLGGLFTGLGSGLGQGFGTKFGQGLGKNLFG